jgi:peptidoglycan/xylan/chitin deacetylase (PgdA/CDA1 family)
MAFKKYFVLNFDDGLEHDKQFISLMKKHGLSGTFNISAGLFGVRHSLAGMSRIPKDEVRQVYEGFEVASHGFKHEKYLFMSAEKVERSLEEDLVELSEVMGYEIVGHAFPYDMRTRAAVNYLRKRKALYTRKAIGAKPQFYFPDDPLTYIATCSFTSPNVMRLLDKFIQAKPEKSDLLFTMWGHSWEMERGFIKCPPAKVERIFAKIAGRDDITYCTSKEAFLRV